jgi:drug/metabolite transporter (DMT)-like permease
MKSRGQVAGALFIACSAMLFASKGILAKALYARGVGFELLVAVRAVLSLPLFWAFALASEGQEAVRATPRAAIAGAVVAGLLCYYGGAMLDFYALTLIDASVERVLLFSYPALVVLFTAVQRRALPDRTIVIAVLLTYVGIFLAVGGFDVAALRRNYTGALFVLLAAVTTAAYFMIGERYTRQIGSARFTLFAMTASTIALVLHFLLLRSPGEVAALKVADWVWLAGLSIACMFVPALLQAEGVRRIGAQMGSVVSTVGPPTTLLLAWLFLSESLNRWQVIGAALILLGILMLDLTQLRRRSSPGQRSS